MYKLFLITFTLIVFSACNNQDKNEAGPAADQTGTTTAEPGNNASGEGSIVGEWEQEYTAFDKNGNNLLDAEERVPSTTKIGDYYYRFNADGKCLYSTMEFEATFELKSEDDQRTILIHGGDPRKLRILSLTGKEMVLMPSSAPGTFFIYKRK